MARSNYADRNYFEKLADTLFKRLAPQENLSLNLTAEASQFVRVNGAKIRQTGSLEQGTLEFQLVYGAPSSGLRRCLRSITLSGLSYEDQNRADEALKAMQTEVRRLPIDPYAEWIDGKETSTAIKQGNPLRMDLAASELLSPVYQIDIAGIYAAGLITRAMASASGHRHWFSTDNFNFDYSFYTESKRAVKGTLAGNHWSSELYLEGIESARQKLSYLEKDPITLRPGSYRCYLAPAATAELLHMMNWGCMGEASIRQGESPIRKVLSGEANFSHLLSLEENFQIGESPRFNAEGELSKEVLPLITQGKLKNTLVSSRTSKEYKIVGNQANSSETMRAPSVSPGNLKEAEILRRIDTGLYVSNLHYLNWSHQFSGRITGMTRYACFWVEKGQLIAPIENMRFDESLFHLLGSHLEDLDEKATFVPETGTYSLRNLGGVNTPGILVSGMNFTL